MSAQVHIWVHGKFRHTTSCQCDIACVHPLFVCKHDLVAAVDKQGGTCFYRLSVAITVCFTTPQDIEEFSVYWRETMFFQCLSSEFCVIATNVAAYTDISRVTGLSHISSLLKGSVTHSERMKIVYFTPRSLDSIMSCFSNHTLVAFTLLKPAGTHFPEHLLRKQSLWFAFTLN